jgi:hypothetical protein
VPEQRLLSPEIRRRWRRSCGTVLEKSSNPLGFSVPRLLIGEGASSGGCQGLLPHSSHGPGLVCKGAGLSWPSGLGMRWILCLEHSPWNSLQLCIWRVFCLTPPSTCNGPSSKTVLVQISEKSQFDSNKVSTCILGNSYTSKCKTRTLCTFATISRLVQINHKSITKYRQNI